MKKTTKKSDTAPIAKHGYSINQQQPISTLASTTTTGNQSQPKILSKHETMDFHQHFKPRSTPRPSFHFLTVVEFFEQL
jgi:hypothetical protein